MPDYSFIAQPQGASMNALGSIMTNLGALQQYRINQLNLQQKQETLPADIARAKALSESAQSEAQTAATGAKSSAFKLQGEQANVMLNEAAALSSDPVMRQDNPAGQIMAVRQSVQRAVSKGVPEWQAELQASHLIPLVQKPGALYQALQNITRANAGPQMQAGVINAPLTPVTTPAGAMGFAQLQPGAANAVPTASVAELNAAGGNVPSAVISPGIQPAQRETPTTDVLGQPAIAVKDNSGNISYKAPPGTNYRPVMQFPQGENAQTLPEVQAIRTQANALGAAAPDQHFNNKMILDLAPDAFTGTGSGKLANALNAIGIKNIAPESLKDPAESKALITHFIALQVQKNAAAMGANTDAARTIAAQAVLPSDSPEKAIKNVTKVNDAYVTGNELYNRGMEAAINNPANQAGPFAARQFRNAWAANFDPRITLLENAQTSGDKETIDRILGPKGSPQRAKATMELLPKARALQALSKGQM